MKSRANLWVVGGIFALALLVVGCGSQWLSGGKLHFSQQRYDRALENFEKAVAEQPNNGEAHLWLGRTLAELERDDEAVVELRKALEIDPLQEEMVTNSFISYWGKRYNSALSYAKDASDQMGDEQAATLEKARERFERAIIFAPDSVQNYSNLGKVLYQMGRLDEAMTMFDKSREMSAGRPDLQAFLFSLYKFFGEQSLMDETRAGYERALSLLHSAESIPAASAEEKIEIDFNIATAYYSLSDSLPESERPAAWEKAAEYYGKVLELNPEDPEAITMLAYVLSDEGKHDEAIQRGQQRFDMAPWESETNLLMHRLYKAAANDKMANGHILMMQILTDGARQPAGTARTEAQAFGPSSDILKVLRDRGEPQEVRAFSVGTTPYSAWCFWSDGRVYIFRDGHEQLRIAFKPVTAEQLQTIMG